MANYNNRYSKWKYRWASGPKSLPKFGFWILRTSPRQPWSRFGHSVRRPGQIVCPNSDSVCPNSDKIYLTVLTFRFLLLFLAYYEKRDSFLPSGSWIVHFWLPAETLSLKRLLGGVFPREHDFFMRELWRTPPTTNFPMQRPTDAALQRALYSAYYAMCCAKAGVATQLCSWIYGLPLQTGHSDDTRFIADSKGICGE